MKKLVFASHNENKVREIRALLPDSFDILSLSDIDFHEDIPETADTLEGNAWIKARTIKEKTGYDCFADDTGLEVFALDMQPGVYSARYAGKERSDEANIKKLLDELKSKSDRGAQFRTAIALIYEGREELFEGRVEGQILTAKRGENGFGYDPVFEPENCGKSFAEQSLEEKNQRSHRARAFAQLKLFLERS